MSFLNNMINQFTHQGQGQQQQQQQQQGYGQSQGGYSQQEFQYQQNSSYGSNQGPPQPPHPWYSEWDNYQSRWVFINRETSERTYEFPSHGGNRGYQQQSYGGGYQQQTYGSQPPQQKSHTGRNVALGAAAGLAGGALLMHEGHKVGESMSSVTNHLSHKLTNHRGTLRRRQISSRREFRLRSRPSRLRC